MWSKGKRLAANAAHAGLLWLLSDGEVVLSVVDEHEYYQIVGYGRRGVWDRLGWVRER